MPTTDKIFQVKLQNLKVPLKLLDTVLGKLKNVTASLKLFDTVLGKLQNEKAPFKLLDTVLGNLKNEAPLKLLGTVQFQVS